MSGMGVINIDVASIVFVLDMLLSAAAAVHATCLSTRSRLPHRGLRIICEVLITVHITLGASVASAFISNESLMALRIWHDIPLDILLWVNAAAAISACATAWLTRNPAMLPEIVVLAMTTPPILEHADILAPLFIIDAAVMFWREARETCIDYQARHAEPSRISIIDAVDEMPEGVLCARPDGGVAYMNNTMRSCLRRLGESTDLADSSALWQSLSGKSRLAYRAGRMVGAPPPESDRLYLGIPNDATRRSGPHEADADFTAGGAAKAQPAETSFLFKTGEANHRGESYRFIAAIDVTEEAEAIRDVARANQLLDAAGEKLKQRIAAAELAAKEDAARRMQRRIHDTLGQRVAILSRLLEGETTDESAVAVMRRVCEGIIDDLKSPESPTMNDELESVIDAFANVGLEVHIDGVLPVDEHVSHTLVDIVREAATNALRHAGATDVHVSIRQEAGTVHVAITNNGGAVGQTDSAHRGMGLRGMAQAVESLGGVFSVDEAQGYSLNATIPLQEGPPPCA